LNRLIYRWVSKCGIGLDELVALYKQCVEEVEPVHNVREIIARLDGEKRSGKNRKETTSRGPVLDFALRIVQCHQRDDLDRALTAYFENPAEAEELPLLVKARRLIGEEYRRPVPRLIPRGGGSFS
jgi:hypothetical protein